MFVACGIWCLADVSSVSPSSEHTIQYFINPFLLGFSGLIYTRLKIELNISNKIITMCY